MAIPERIVLNADELTLHLVATGVLALIKVWEKGESLTLPYPNALQQGLNRLAVAGLRRGDAPISSASELLSWCQRPLREWPLNIEGGEEAGTLLLGTLPTGFCEAWACAASDVEAALTEEKLMLSALSACQSAGAPEAYVAFRRLMIERPVLTALQLQQHLASEDFEVVNEHLRQAYQPAPKACITPQAQLLCCSTCGNLLLRTGDGEMVCEEERCRFLHKRHESTPAGRVLRARDEVVWLKRGLRRFVASPGRAELRLEAELQKLGLDVELWPEFDRYDLRLRFSDGEAWAVDVKDWADPVLLAKRIRAQMPTPIPNSPPWTRAYFVFPQERKQERPDYLRAFKNGCGLSEKVSPSLRAAFECDFLGDVKRKMEAI